MYQDALELVPENHHKTIIILILQAASLYPGSHS